MRLVSTISLLVELDELGIEVRRRRGGWFWWDVETLKQADLASILDPKDAPIYGPFTSALVAAQNAMWTIKVDAA